MKGKRLFGYILTAVLGAITAVLGQWFTEYSSKEEIKKLYEEEKGLR